MQVPMSLALRVRWVLGAAAPLLSCRARHRLALHHASCATRRSACPTPCSDVDHTEAGGILSAGEYARELLVKMHGDPAFNATWAVHWAAQPPREETFTAGDLAAAAERGWLQQPHLVCDGRSGEWRGMSQRQQLQRPPSCLAA